MTLVEKIPDTIYLLSGRMILLGIGFLLLVALIFVFFHPLVDDFYKSGKMELITYIAIGFSWGTVLLFYMILGVTIAIEWVFFDPFM